MSQYFSFSSRRTKRLMVGVVGLAAWTAMSVVALAQPGWTPSVPVGGFGNQQVAIDGAGHALTAWSDINGVRAADYSATVDRWGGAAVLGDGSNEITVVVP